MERFDLLDLSSKTKLLLMNNPNEPPQLVNKLSQAASLESITCAVQNSWLEVRVHINGGLIRIYQQTDQGT